MSAQPGPGEPRIYQLKITLKDAKPRIWRRVLVPGEATLADLHDVIQAAMGWEDYHLHAFRIGRVEYQAPDPEAGAWGEAPQNENRYALQEVVPQAKAKFSYEYDFGDSWRHELLVEKILPVEKGQHYPVCTGGERAAPPEDSGGVWGYAELLEALRDPEHEEHEELVAWAGEGFDPEHFDLEEANARMARLQRRHRRRLSPDAGTEATAAEALAPLKVPKALRLRALQIMELTDRFAQEHLDPEYAHAARRVIASLARKRPSPLLSGEPRVWAGIALHIVLGLNLLFDLKRDPHLEGGQLSELAGIPLDRLTEQSELVLGQLNLQPAELMLARHREPFEELALWMMDVEAGLADPGFPPPAIQPIIDRIELLAEEAESARAEASRPRLVQGPPLLRLIELPPPEEGEEPDEEA